MATAPPADHNDELVDIHDRIPRPTPNPICSSTTHRVSFRHPAYDSTRLIELPAFDGPTGSIHHGTALLVCGIIAGNIWDGWLTEGRCGNKVNLGKDVVLGGKEYFFHVPWPSNSSEEDRARGPYKYPIVPSFQHWPFPHDNPPPGWNFTPDLTTGVSSILPIPSLSNASQAVRDRDRSCRLSDYRDGIERAHLCPRSEVEWFTQQEMDRYNISRSLVGAGLVDDTANALTLRSDIHDSFDAGTFVFTRKWDRWVSHFLAPTSNLGPEHHNITVKIPPTVHPAFILARFAWAIFPGIRNFLIRGEKRLVTLRQGVGEAWDVRELERDGLCRVLGLPPRGRSISPKKRQREEDTTGNASGAAATTKRTRLGIAESEQSIESPDSPLADTPGLCNTDTASTASEPLKPIDPSTVEVNDEATERRRIASFCQAALKAQRPSEPELVCCDYTEAERANAAGLQGPRKFGGAHLCLECLGAEYRDEDLGDITPVLAMEDGRRDILIPG